MLNLKQTSNPAVSAILNIDKNSELLIRVDSEEAAKLCRISSNEKGTEWSIDDKDGHLLFVGVHRSLHLLKCNLLQAYYNGTVKSVALIEKESPLIEK